MLCCRSLVAFASLVATVNAHRALVDPLGESPTLWCVTHGMPEMLPTSSPVH